MPALRRLSVAAVALLLTSAPAAAQPLANDARCFIVSNVFAKSRDEKASRAGVEARYFYLGRLTGSTAQIEAAIAAQGRTITAQNAGALMQGCVRGVVLKGNELQGIGQRLSKAQHK